MKSDGLADDKTMAVNRKMRASYGFTLIEMLIVLAIMAIILVASIPSSGGKVDQVGVNEALNLVKIYQPQIESYYKMTGEFPVDNAALGIPAPESIIGNYLTAVHLDGGALHLQLGNKVRPQLKGKIISIRPVFVPDTPNAPISWICGNDSVPVNMLAAGDNRTNLEPLSLPNSCR